ncbi:outer membrane protein [Novosphingobium album (ex Liu et al. 2023)]|uniref:Outer membrane beta-barrel protein n=1 Tax=Novosphingobium album (ex Liu et al. 2023) TaxID=3031130 RepID=A0ABT5WP90_9SPHN|nr:outer membrane beta-barrel protein [Novosphingobium album (ex Liu et al. 2023)]MDE8651566.1 outer membrane beta-barrel protein [Novosphingobium album (ex Liu et al. 2023)]
MKKIFVCIATGGALVSVPALAQDTASPFTGPRVEAIVGYDKTRAGSSVDTDAAVGNKQSMDGVLYGVGAGYDVDLGSVVLGAEAEVTDSTAKQSFGAGDFEGFGSGNIKTNRDLYVGARAGVKVAPTTLLYAKAGYTNGRFGAYSSDGEVAYREKFDADGYRVGAGVEQAVGRNTFAKLEYRYSNYSKGEIDFGDDLPDSQRFDVDLDRHQVVASVGMRF